MARDEGRNQKSEDQKKYEYSIYSYKMNKINKVKKKINKKWFIFNKWKEIF